MSRNPQRLSVLIATWTKLCIHPSQQIDDGCWETSLCAVGRKQAHRRLLLPVSTTVGDSPGVRVSDSKKVILPGMSMSNR